MCIVFGTGGVARAIAFGLKKSKSKVIVLGRNQQKAIRIYNDLGLDGYGKIEDWKQFDAEIFINATSIGMDGSKSSINLLDYYKGICCLVSR